VSKFEELKKLWDCAKENLTTKGINKLLLSTDNKGRAAWHLEAKWGNLEAFKNYGSVLNRI